MMLLVLGSFMKCKLVSMESNNDNTASDDDLLEIS